MTSVRTENFTGFGDDPNWSVKFGVQGQPGADRDWVSGPRVAELTPATGHRTIRQYRGRDPYEIKLELLFDDSDAMEALDAMVGRSATLRIPWGHTKRVGGTLEVIGNEQYLKLPGTYLASLEEHSGYISYPGGIRKGTATFRRAYVDPAPFVAPTWPAPPSPYPLYHDAVLATPGLVTYHTMAGGATEASIGPDTALMTHTGSPASVAAPGLLVRGDGAKQYSGTTMESSFSSTALSGATAGSMECWFRETSLVTWAHIFENDDYPSSRMQIIRQASSGNITAGFRDPVGGVDYGCTGPYNQLALNHLVATFGGGAIKLYINGVQVATSAHAGFFPTGSKTYRVNKIGSQAFVGTVDDVAIYNVALSPATIMQHYKAGAT